jgi:hypothetical protein
VSKKTIAFTMPAGPRPRAPVVLDGLTGESIPVGVSDEPDDWVRDRDLRHEGDPPPTAGQTLRPFAVGASVTVNLSADRTLMEAMALSWMAPFAIGWFWYVNAMTRPYRLWRP